jgi:hydrogenase maturation protein HypF
MAEACSIRVRGIVQGVGFRPFIYRLARSHALNGWVLNAENGVEIHLEGDPSAIEAFVHRLKTQPPPAANIAEIDIKTEAPQGFSDFTIRESERRDRPTVRISPDLPVCDACLQEMFDPSDRRYRYPYINCTNCGPRYTVILSLPYDRPATTMKDWPLDPYCSGEYHDPGNRRFHAQPVACPQCGPRFQLLDGEATCVGDAAIQSAAHRLREGSILGVKGLGGYHLACDAANVGAVRALRERKYRKEKPFAVMAKNLAVARGLVELPPAGEQLLTSSARPIVLARARRTLEAVAPDTDELGIMLPYAPLHHLLFSAGAPDVLVMTSANRSSEPIAYEDADARERLSGIADALLVGERPIARRVDDSVARAGTFGPVILRRSRGYAPGAVTSLPLRRPVLAVGADLKNAITLVVDGQAFVSQHIGDLDHYQALVAFEETIRDLVSMYDVGWEDLLVIHDAHPQYASSLHALKLSCAERRAVQHHRAHVASVLAERGDWDTQVLGVSFDGTGYGDDGSIWGGEVFAGSIRKGFERVAHLRPALLPGGDAAAQFPVQAAAGFLCQVEGLPDLTKPPFNFPPRFTKALDLAGKAVRTFPTTSVGRLFDTAAALLGFVREITYEGQAAMWLEHQARKSSSCIEAFPFPFASNELDFRPLLSSVAEERLRGTAPSVIARAFQRAVAQGLADAVTSLCQKHKIEVLVMSGGVFQNDLLLEDLRDLLQGTPLQVWTNHAVPPNDGGISLGQAALGALQGT